MKINQDNMNKIRQGLPEIDQRDQNNFAGLMSIKSMDKLLYVSRKRIIDVM